VKARYVVAKFVPDVVRFEPVNIGLVVEIDDRVITKMATDVDPRIRLADPYVDLPSLRDFLTSFDARDYSGKADSSPIEWLQQNRLPNVYFTKPLEIEASVRGIDDIVNALHARIVDRKFEQPPDLVRSAGVSAARTALREAFRTAGVLGRRVESQVLVRGASGVDWRIDFRYLTESNVNMVEAATTDLQEDVRRKEHAFEAFATLIDVTQGPRQAKSMTREEKIDQRTEHPPVGILAVDAKPSENATSELLAHMAEAHGFRFVAGQRAFFDLANGLRDEALPIADSASPSSQALTWTDR